MCPLVEGLATGIVAIQHERSDGIHSALEEENVHVSCTTPAACDSPFMATTRAKIFRSC